MNQTYTVIFKYYMFYITESTQQTRPDRDADKHEQNINLLFCNNYKGDANRMQITRTEQILVD